MATEVAISTYSTIGGCQPNCEHYGKSKYLENQLDKYKIQMADAKRVLFRCQKIIGQQILDIKKKPECDKVHGLTKDQQLEYDKAMDEATQMKMAYRELMVEHEVQFKELKEIKRLVKEICLGKDKITSIYFEHPNDKQQKGMIEKLKKENEELKEQLKVSKEKETKELIKFTELEFNLFQYIRQLDLSGNEVLRLSERITNLDNQSRQKDQIISRCNEKVKMVCYALSELQNKVITLEASVDSCNKKIIDTSINKMMENVYNYFIQCAPNNKQYHNQFKQLINVVMDKFILLANEVEQLRSEELNSDFYNSIIELNENNIITESDLKDVKDLVSVRNIEIDDLQYKLKEANKLNLELKDTITKLEKEKEQSLTKVIEKEVEKEVDQNNNNSNEQYIELNDSKDLNYKLVIEDLEHKLRLNQGDVRCFKNKLTCIEASNNELKDSLIKAELQVYELSDQLKIEREKDKKKDLEDHCSINEHDTLIENFQKLKNQYFELDSKYQNILKENECLEFDLGELTQRFNDKMSEVNEEILEKSKHINYLEMSKERWEKDEINLKYEVSRLEEQNNKLIKHNQGNENLLKWDQEKEMKRISNQDSELNAKLAEANEKIKQLEQQNKLLEDGRVELVDVLDKIKKEKLSLINKLNHANNNKNDLDKEIGYLKQAISNIKQLNNSLNKQLDQYKAKEKDYKSLEKEVEDTIDYLQVHNNEILQENKQLKEKNLYLVSLIKHYNEVYKQAKGNGLSLHPKNNKLDSLVEENNDIESDKELIEESNNDNNINDDQVENVCMSDKGEDKEEIIETNNNDESDLTILIKDNNNSYNNNEIEEKNKINKLKGILNIDLIDISKINHNKLEDLDSNNLTFDNNLNVNLEESDQDTYSVDNNS